MLRPFDPFRETMHDTTGLSPYIETDFRYGRKPVSISSEGICLPHPKFSLPGHSVANRRKNGLSMNTDSPNVQRGPVRSIDVEPHPASSATRIGKLFQHGRLSLAQIERNRSPIGSRRERKPRDRSSGNYFEKKLYGTAFFAFVFKRKIVFVRSDRPTPDRRMNIRIDAALFSLQQIGEPGFVTEIIRQILEPFENCFISNTAPAPPPSNSCMREPILPHPHCSTACPISNS